MSDDPNYRPRSPDLSTFAPPPRLNHLPSYHQDPGLPQGYPLGPRGSYDASPYFSPATAKPPTSYFGSQPHAQSQTSSPQVYQSRELPTSNASIFASNDITPRHSAPSQRLPSSIPQPDYRYPSQAQPSLFSHPPPIFTQPTYSQQPPPAFFQQPSSTPSDMARTRRRKSATPDSSEDASYTPDSLAPSRTSKKRKSETLSHDYSAQSAPFSSTYPPTSPLLAIKIATKFPVARIKRLMQADEDVGKVAQATPTAVSKALELFMLTLVSHGVTEARQKGSKKVTAQHLKAALMKEPEKFDFLEGICEKVGDAPEGKKRAKSEDQDSMEDGDEGGVAGKKRRGKSSGGGRKGTKVEAMEEESD